MTAGYSGTPLAKKLGIKPDSTLTVLNDPGHFDEIVHPIPGDVARRTTLRGPSDLVVFFTKERSKLERRIDAIGRTIFPDGAVWVCWPKRASKVPTDMTEDVVRDIVLPLSLVDIKVAAIDETWSGLKVVWRKERR